MRKVLLTSSQVSVIISSTIIFLFTLAIFLAGYTLQQRTVQSLQSSLRPKLPLAPPNHPSLQQQNDASTLRSSRHFTAPAPDTPLPELDWTRLAHAQIITSHAQVCSAIMLFADLHRLKSPAKRVLLFPHSWAVDPEARRGETFGDPWVETSRRLLRRGVRRFGVELRPVLASSRAHVADGISGGVEDAGENVIGLDSVFGLLDYDRISVLRAPGAVMDAEALDRVLAYAPDSAFASIGGSTEGVEDDDLVLVAPSKEARDMVTEAGARDAMTVRAVLSDSLVLDDSADEHKLVGSIAAFHKPRQDEAFDATAFLSEVAYLRFSDPKLPGPEYEVPYADRLAARPRNNEADWVWTKLYSSFAQKRMDVCGLDLEPYHDYSS